MEAILTKSAFADLLGVRRSAVSEWIRRKKLSGDAIVGSGYSSRIRVQEAREQLRNSLEATGRETSIPPMGVNRRPSIDDDGTIEDGIKRARREGLELANQKLREDAALRNGRYVLTETVRQELGRNQSRLLTLFDSTITEFVNALAASGVTSPREMTRVLRDTWHAIRTKAADEFAAEAQKVDPFVTDPEEIGT